MPEATLPQLPYGYDALEPYISKEIMHLHHTKHHQAYVNNLNAAEKNYASATTPQEQIALQAAIKFNGGGHINHSFFWKILAPAGEQGGKLHDCALEKALVGTFGSVDNFKKDFNAATAAIQGSGWGWLVFNKKTGRLEIVTTPNQDPILEPSVPIIGVDIWEHAFYLQYKNDKVEYLKQIWNVINWSEADRLYNDAESKAAKM